MRTGECRRAMAGRRLAGSVAMAGLVLSGLARPAHAADGNDVSTYVGGAFNWNTDTNWEGATIANGSGAVATFDNNYTGGVATTFTGPITLGAIRYTDTSTPQTLSLQAGAGNTQTLTFADDADNVANIAVNDANGVPLQFGGNSVGTLNIAGAANLNLVLDSTSTNNVRFAGGVNWGNFLGRVTMNTGRFQTEAANVLPQNAPIVVGDGVQVRAVFNNTRDQQVRGLIGGSSTTFVGNTDAATGTGNLTVGVNTVAADTYDFSGVLGGDAFTVGQANNNFNLVKSGAGTQILSGASLYSGTTTVNGGTLLVNGSHAGAGNYTVAAAGTLGGTGTIALAASSNTVTVNGKLTPGSATAIGSLDVTTGGLTLAGTADFQVDLATGLADKVNVGDLLTYGGVLDVAFAGSNPAGGTYDLFDFGSGTGAFTGVAFSNLPLGQTATFDATTGAVTLSAVPEPTTFGLLAVVALGVTLRRRRRSA